MNIKNKTNEYVDYIGLAFDGIPKTVFAAIAFSLAMRIHADDKEFAKSEIFQEWEILWKNGIVTQRPPYMNKHGGLK